MVNLFHSAWVILPTAFWLTYGVGEPQPGVVATSIGLTPGALAASGGAQADAGSVLASVEARRADVWAAGLARSSASDLLDQVGALRAHLTDDPTDDLARAALAKALTALEDANRELGAAESAICRAALGSLDPVIAARVEACVAQGSGDAPAYFVLAYGHDGAVRYELALIAEARALRRGVSPPGPVQSFLSRIRSEGDYVAAAIRHDQCITEVEDAYGSR